MLSFEDSLQAELNAAGMLAERKQLENLDADGSPIFLANVKMTSKKEKQLKIYETHYGAVEVPRWVSKLEKVKTYFKNHWQKMNYAQALENNYPIGSGVTEAACKTLIKTRMCRSGMRWKKEGASMLLTLRALVCPTGVWDKFRVKISNYGFPAMHNI